MCAEVGKPITWARAEVDRAALTFELAASLACDSAVSDVSYDPRGANFSAEVHRVPLGVVLAITPYNWPFNLAAHKIAPALALGNVVILKGSEMASLCTLTLARILHECGTPAGVVQALNIDLPLAKRLVVDPRIDKISFTGSAAVGWGLRGAIGSTRLTLELGGNAFALVDADADLDAVVARLVPSAFGYAGQVCISAQNVLAHQSVFEALKARLTAAASQIEVTDPRAEEALCGPMITAVAAARANERVQAAVAAGAKVLMGSEPNGNRMPPTLLEIADFALAQRNDMFLASEEVFAPVLTISPVPSLDEALRIVNQGRYGIHTAIFTQDEGLIECAAQALKVGGIVVNDAPSIRFDGLPYGGEKASGLGREGTASAVHEYTRPLTVVRRVIG